ncbi:MULTISPECIES: hypothetical protein [unclassified Rathayibacter]|uniref:hypothetical protein n=1 Tax=unclassified Rathayibacter TaxID=2609250 RepID=UPI000CE8A9FA|nr:MULTISPECIES: hypothetical protein [unclassified Rathayibacter]PPH17732.1 hypothetical protein C5C35_06530 [Rathayibacter sp. AY1F8]PPH77462.1 hypothetical protein C5C90_02155 [Rathayibacter sp. AY1D4]PPH85469.1 hypothetical protein C5C64_16300 [Rathayibacter sp. AY1D3]QHC74703.1 hypothetical protein GSU40_14020 [Rathayibacter sp. VKM Ac-2805]
MIDARALASGTWFVRGSSLPLWRSRSGVAITYAPLPTGGIGDVVSWRGRTRSHYVVGIDTPDPHDPSGFRWRGVEPLTLLARSRWSFVAADEEAGWALTRFARTPFTPAGVDVYVRDPHPARGVLAAALAACAADPRTSALRPRLFEVAP